MGVLWRSSLVLRSTTLRSRPSTCAFQDVFINTVTQKRGVSMLTREEEERRREIDASIGKFLTKTYTATGAGVLGFLATAQAASMTGVALSNPYVTLGVGFLGSIGSSLLLARSQPMYFAQGGEIVAVNSLGRQIAFATLCGSFGLMSSPLVGYMMHTNPSIVAAAFLSSTATMAGASAYALTTKRDVTVFGSALTGGLVGLIGVSFTGIAAGWLGYPGLASSLHSLTAYGTVVVFTGLTAYDTQIAIAMHKMKQPDHLGAASQFFMNFANLFQGFMRIFHSND